MESIFLDNERQLGVAVAEARMAVVRSLRAQEFTLTNEQVSMVTAKRGSQIVGSVHSKKLPIIVKIALAPAGDGCTVSIHIADGWRSPVGKVWGMNGPFRTVIDEVQAALDDALAPLGGGGASFAANDVQSATKDIPGLSHMNQGAARAGAVAGGKIDALLDGPSHDSTPKALKEVVLRSSKGVASFDRMAVHGLFTVGLLVSSKPGAMPANLARDVEAFSSKIETAVADHPQGSVVVELADSEIAVAEFLGKQADIRTGLPLRTLQVCTTCKLERVVNPDFKKLQERNQRKRVLSGAVGATVSSSGISPFLLIGSLIKLKNFDIPFVCNRCQGLDADSSIVTYCPQCGERRSEAVLRTCPRCTYSFVNAHDHEHPEGFWQPHPDVTTAALALRDAPAAGFAVPASISPLSANEQATTPQPSPLSAPTLSPTPQPFPAPAPRAPAAAATPLPAWYADPTGRHQHRYWDGAQWTTSVANNGQPGNDTI